MTTIFNFLESTLAKMLLTFAHNWPYLLASILIGSLIKLFLDKDRVAGYLQKHQKGGVLLATAAAVGTPLCSCGTTAVVIGMMASMMPWAPIVAFMVSSPLSSPEGMVYSAGLFGWPFHRPASSLRSFLDWPVACSRRYWTGLVGSRTRTASRLYQSLQPLRHSN